MLLLVSPVRCRLTRRPGRLPAPVQKVSAAFCRNSSCKRLLASQLRNQRKAINPPSPGCKNQKCVKKCVIDAENRLDSNESKRFFFMPVVGVEPTRYHYQWILSPHRLPFRHTGTSVDVQQHYYSGFLHQNQAVFFLFSRASYGSGRSPPLRRAVYIPFCCRSFQKIPALSRPSLCRVLSRSGPATVCTGQEHCGQLYPTIPPQAI